MVQHVYRPDISTLGPQHAGMRMSAAEFVAAPTEDGYRFELIGGVLEVSPAPEPYAQNLADAIQAMLRNHRRPDGTTAFREVTHSARVFLPPNCEADTIPEPDVAAYETYPRKPVESYRDLRPTIVVEIVSPWGADKDYIRNPRLYALVPSILENWIVDPRKDKLRPTMTVHRRDAGDQPFERIDIPPGGCYEPPRWPGLRIDLTAAASD